MIPLPASELQALTEQLQRQEDESIRYRRFLEDLLANLDEENMPKVWKKISEDGSEVAALRLFCDSLSLSVSNEDASSELKLMAGEAVLSSRRISMEGLVTFTDLCGEGRSTTVSGDLITTGRLRSGNYTAGNDGFSAGGSELNLTDGSFHSRYFSLGADGAVSMVGGLLSGGSITGAALSLGGGGNAGELTVQDGDGHVIGSWSGSGIFASAGQIGGWTVGDNSLTYCNTVDRLATLGAGGLEYRRGNSRILAGADETTGQPVLSIYDESAGTLRLRGMTLAALSQSGGAGEGYLTGTWHMDSAPIVTSDLACKCDLRPLSEAEERFFDALCPVSYILRGELAVEGRIPARHTGFVAQQVAQALREAGLDPAEQGVVTGCTGRRGEGTPGLRYEEFIALLTEQVQRLKARVCALESCRIANGGKEENHHG